MMIYGYRRPPYGVKGVVSEDGLTWDEKNSFFVAENGVPGKPGTKSGDATRPIEWENPGVYQHIGYPSVVQTTDGVIVASYHEWEDKERPLQFVRATRFRLAD